MSARIQDSAVATRNPTLMWLKNEGDGSRGFFKGFRPVLKKVGRHLASFPRPKNELTTQDPNSPKHSEPSRPQWEPWKPGPRKIQFTAWCLFFHCQAACHTPCMGWPHTVSHFVQLPVQKTPWNRLHKLSTFSVFLNSSCPQKRSLHVHRKHYKATGYK